MAEALKRGNDFWLNFFGGIILGAPGTLLFGMIALVLTRSITGMSTPDRPAEVWPSIGVTAGAAAVLGIASLVAGLSVKRGRSFAVGLFVGALFSVVLWFLVFAASAGTR